jgi:hypothetical protein
LAFITGADTVPPLGFNPQPRIEFLHDAVASIIGNYTYVSPYPLAGTCANTIMLPLHKTYELFKEKMEDGIIMSPGFGRA